METLLHTLMDHMEIWSRIICGFGTRDPLRSVVFSLCLEQSCECVYFSFSYCIPEEPQEKVMVFRQVPHWSCAPVTTGCDTLVVPMGHPAQDTLPIPLLTPGIKAIHV